MNIYMNIFIYSHTYIYLDGSSFRTSGTCSSFRTPRNVLALCSSMRPPIMRVSDFRRERRRAAFGKASRKGLRKG